MISKLILLVSALVTLTASGQQKPTYPDSEAEKHVGEEARITGKLVNVFTSGSGTTFLNLGDRFPRQTFGAVIFASKQAAVGDVKQYEGKDVVLTGRIELSKDQKPQIIINSADQIQVAGAVSPAAPTPVAAPTMPATPVPPTGTPPPASPEPAPIVEKQTGKIQLTMGWNSPQNGGEMARKDLAKLFGLAGSANDATLVDASFEVYPGIRFLTPVNVARKLLKLETAQYIKSKVETSGFPQDTLNTHTFGGVFPGGFTRLVLVTDSTDQIVSVLLVDSSPRTRVENVPDTTGYHTYNFISGSGKASNDLQIKHQIRPDSIGTNVIVVDSLLIDPEDQSPSRKTKSSSAKSSSFSRQKTGKVLESSRWYVPAPIVNLILHCVGG